MIIQLTEGRLVVRTSAAKNCEGAIMVISEFDMFLHMQLFLSQKK